MSGAAAASVYEWLVPVRQRPARAPTTRRVLAWERLLTECRTHARHIYERLVDALQPHTVPAAVLRLCLAYVGPGYHHELRLTAAGQAHVVSVPGSFDDPHLLSTVRWTLLDAETALQYFYEVRGRLKIDVAGSDPRLRRLLRDHKPHTRWYAQTRRLRGTQLCALCDARARLHPDAHSHARSHVVDITVAADNRHLLALPLPWQWIKGKAPDPPLAASSVGP